MINFTEKLARKENLIFLMNRHSTKSKELAAGLKKRNGKPYTAMAINSMRYGQVDINNFVADQIADFYNIPRKKFKHEHLRSKVDEILLNYGRTHSYDTDEKKLMEGLTGQKIS